MGKIGIWAPAPHPCADVAFVHSRESLQRAGAMFSLLILSV